MVLIDCKWSVAEPALLWHGPRSGYCMASGQIKHLCYNPQNESRFLLTIRWLCHVSQRLINSPNKARGLDRLSTIEKIEFLLKISGGKIYRTFFLVLLWPMASLLIEPQSASANAAPAAFITCTVSIRATDVLP
jgi:hypothetical protein